MIPARAVEWLRQIHSESAIFTHTRILDSLHAVSNLLFPPCCAFCQQELDGAPDAPSLCDRCIQVFTQTRRACRFCASPLPALWPADLKCSKCTRRGYRFERATALGDYRGDLQQAVLAMKRLAFEPLTQAMGLLVAQQLQADLADWQPQCVVPVPMHFWRRLKRGIHTSHVLGDQVARIMGLPLADRTVACRRKLRKQGTLSIAERHRNVRDAFSISSGYDITDRRVLLVDDIMTTGATANEAARMLRKHGAAAVAVAVVARGVGRQ